MRQVEYFTRAFYQNCRQRHYSHPVIQAFAKPKIDWIQSKINLQNKSVLEVGAGNGYISFILQKVAQVAVLDISEHQLAENPIKDKHLDSAYNLPFEDNSFDICLCSNLLHHLEDPEKVIMEMGRVSRKYIIISEPNRRNPLTFFGAHLFKHEKNGVMYSKEYLTDLIKRCGLIVEYHTYQGGLVMPNATPTILLRFTKPKSKSSLSFFQICICKKT